MGFKQPGLEGGVPAYSRVLELDDLKGPFQPKPFYDSVIIIIRLVVFIPFSPFPLIAKPCGVRVLHGADCISPLFCRVWRAAWHSLSVYLVLCRVLHFLVSSLG